MKVEEYHELIDGMTWSFSRLNYSCEFCWLQNYILKNRDLGENNAFAEYGLLLHELSEDYVQNKLLPWQLESIYKDRFKGISKFPPNKYVILRDGYYEQGVEFLKLQYDFLENYDIIGVEEEVTTTLNNGKPFTGYIDLILKDDDGYIVFDWKSKKGWKNIKERNDYARQLYMYSKHIKEKYGEFPKKLVFYHFRTQKMTTIKFDKEMYDEAFDWAENQIDKLRDLRKFEVTDNYFFGNYLCNFRNLNGHKKGNVIKLEDVELE
jgi:hypothetical protein